MGKVQMNAYSYQKHQLSDAERLWLEEVNKATIKFDRRVARVTLLGKIPDTFDPDSIDQRLCQTREGKLTPIGIWHIDSASPLLSAVDTVVRTIRGLIIESPNTTNEVSVPQLSKLTGLDQSLVARSLLALGELGSFFSGGAYAPDGVGYSKISLVGDYSYDEYIAYKSLDDLLERYYVRRNPSRASPNIVFGGTTAGFSFGAFDQAIEQKPIKRNTAFVLMSMDPSKAELEDVYSAIKDVCKEFEIAAYRADEIQHEGRITDRILQEITTCEYLIADLSYERPNVYYEIGYAHALDKKPILYRRKGTRLHFDLSIHNAPEYKNITELRDLLRTRFSAILGRDPKSSGS